MKKIILVSTLSIMLVVITAYSAFSQLSIKAVGGYQFSLAGGSVGDPNLGFTNNTNGAQTGVYGSWASGGVFGLALDYKFCPCFTLELGGRYWDGSTIKNSSITTDATTGDITDDEYQGNLNMFALSLGDIQDFSCSDGKFTPYLGFGLDFGVGGEIKNNETNTSTGSGVTSIISNVTGNFAVGAYGELGVKYKLTDHLSILGEFRFDALSLYANKLTVTSVMVNGLDVTGNVPLSETETDYSKSVPANVNTNSAAPTQALTYSVPASAWGVNIGIMWTFGDSSSSTSKK